MIEATLLTMLVSAGMITVFILGVFSIVLLLMLLDSLFF